MNDDFGNIMKQAQQMQAHLKKAQENIATTEVTGQSGAGMVQVVMTGKHDVTRVQIDPELMGEEKAMLEDLIAAAVNDANRRVEAITKEKLSGLAGGLGLPEALNCHFEAACVDPSPG